MSGCRLYGTIVTYGYITHLVVRHRTVSFNILLLGRRLCPKYSLEKPCHRLCGALGGVLKTICKFSQRSPLSPVGKPRYDKSYVALPDSRLHTLCEHIVHVNSVSIQSGECYKWFFSLRSQGLTGSVLPASMTVR